MHCKILNNHIILSVPTNKGLKTVLVDTGAPMTIFSDDDVLSVEVDGVSYNVSMNPMRKIYASGALNECTDNMVGCHVEGLIGADFFAEHDVLVDFAKGVLNVDSGNPVPENTLTLCEGFMGVKKFEMAVNGRPLSAFFDTGNRRTFVRSDLVESLGLEPTDETMDDYNPIIGHFTVKAYRGCVKLGEKVLENQKVLVGSAYDHCSRAVGVDGFLGVETVAQSTVWFSYKTMKISVK
ncbi:MAG: retropepsin-like domain-containing protein [Fibrobacter sp.]|nr:retropepsin-like domain-containing protein [Fibrobacter sp.]